MSVMKSRVSIPSSMTCLESTLDDVPQLLAHCVTRILNLQIPPFRNNLLRSKWAFRVPPSWICPPLLHSLNIRLVQLVLLIDWRHICRYRVNEVLLFCHFCGDVLDTSGTEERQATQGWRSVTGPDVMNCPSLGGGVENRWITSFEPKFGWTRSSGRLWGASGRGELDIVPLWEVHGLVIHYYYMRAWSLQRAAYGQTACC